MREHLHNKRLCIGVGIGVSVVFIMAKEIMYTAASESVLYSYGDKENAPSNFDFENRRRIEREALLADKGGVAEPKWQPSSSSSGNSSGSNSSSSSSSSSSSRSRAGAKSGGVFGRLLVEVKHEKKHEMEDQDEQVAIQQQVNEAVAMAREWLSEDADCKLASEVQATWEREDKLGRQLQVSRGEAEALNIAIEERRRVCAECEAKKAREQADAELVRRTLQEEEADDLALSSLIARDDEFALRYHATLQDELVAEDMARAEEARAKSEMARLEAISAQVL